MSIALQDAVTACFMKTHQVIAAHQARQDSLMGGKLGLCLYYMQLHQALGDGRFADTAISLLEQVIAGNDDPKAQLSGASYSMGTTGLGFIIELMKAGGYIDMEEADVMEMIDDVVFKLAAEAMIPRQQHDFLHGGMGVLHYFSQRLHVARVNSYAGQLAGIFCRNVVQEPEGYWFRNAVFSGDNPGEINLSLSHGNSGFLILLMNLCEGGVAVAAAKDVVEKGMELLLHYRVQSQESLTGQGLFPATVNSLKKTERSTTYRLGWCYGDLNIVMALYRAAKFLNKPDWHLLAGELGLATLARRDAKSAAIADAHFCHGASGLAQCYQCLYDLDNRQEYLEARDGWLRQTIDFLAQQLPAGHYAGKECNLLDGLPGANLVLLSFLHPTTSTWPRTFLL